MNYIVIIAILGLTACASTMDQEQLKAEQYFHAVQSYPDLDPDYIDDCIYYDTVKCDFE